MVPKRLPMYLYSSLAPLCPSACTVRAWFCLPSFTIAKCEHSPSSCTTRDQNKQKESASEEQ